LELTACHGSKNITLRSSLAQRRSDGPMPGCSNAMLMLLREREIREMMDMIVVI
jgi:hypothetical protein